MATTEQYAKWLINNQDKKGTDEFNTVAEAYKQSKNLDVRPEINKVAEGLRKVASGATFGFADEIEAGLKSIAQGAKKSNLGSVGLAGGLPDLNNLPMKTSVVPFDDTSYLPKETGKSNYQIERDKLRAQAKEFERQYPKTALSLEVIGGIATPGGLAKTGLTKAQTIGQGVKQGLGYGGLYGAGTAEEMKDIPSNVAKYGITGGLTGGALSTLGTAIAPKIQTGAKELQKQGVNLTPGQAFGGITDIIEQRAGTVLPGINTARTKNIESWNASIIDNILKPLNKVAAKKGASLHENVNSAQKVLSKSYDDLLPNVSLKYDKTFKDDVTNIFTKISDDLTPDAQNKLLKTVTKIGDQLKVNKSGQTIKNIQSDLGNKITRYSTSTNSDDKAVGEALEGILDSMLSSLERQNPKYAGKLKTINNAYAKLIRVEKAAIKDTMGEVFTPKQLAAAVRESDRSARKRAVAAGEALLQDTAKAGKILGSEIKDSGTAANLITNALIGGSILNPSLLSYAIPGISSKILYSEPFQKAFNAWLKAGNKPTQQAIRDFAQKYASSLSTGLLTTIE